MRSAANGLQWARLLRWTFLVGALALCVCTSLRHMAREEVVGVKEVVR